MLQIDQSHLKECLSYNKRTGEFTWNTRPARHFCMERIMKMWNTKYSGVAAGTMRKNGYVYIDIDGFGFKAHRLAMIYENGSCSLPVDHINGNPSDNRMCNLRLATMMQNAHNRKTPVTNRTGVKGVSVHRETGKFMASVTFNRKRTYLGLFSNLEDAAKAVSAKRAELHGEFACNG